MARSFKFRYVNEIVGTFVILVLVLLLAGIFLAGKSQQWFVARHHLTLDFPPQGSMGLQPGAEVVILGTVVGSLDEINVDDAGDMTGQITIKGDFIRFVRDDSRVVVKKKFVVAGDSYIEITRGKGKQLEPEAVLKAEKDTEVTEMAQKLVGKIEEAAIPAIEQGQKALEEYTALGADLRDPDGNLQQLVARFASIAAGLDEGEGLAGSFLQDPAMADEVTALITRLNDSSRKLVGIVDDLAATASQFPPLMKKVRTEADDAPGLVLQARQALEEATTLLQALQKHWLISSYVGPREDGTRLAPAGLDMEGGGQ